MAVILNAHSRAVAGYTVFLGSPTPVQTALALRQAIWRKTHPRWPVCGIPATLYSDHGADFTSTHINHMAGVCCDVANRLDQLRTKPPAWTTAVQLTDLAGVYRRRAGNLRKDAHRQHDQAD